MNLKEELEIELGNMDERLTPRKPREEESRTAWEVDLSRLIHSASYRRLQAKTQVLGLGESDFYRTRLTHSMEVAQIALGIRNHVYQKSMASKETYISRILPDPNLMMAIGLAHDLGHPPFGHGGEIALNYCMREYGGFEGNAQTLRIISKLEKYDKDYGINPTRRLMLGVLKYPVIYEKAVNIKAYGTCSDLSQPKWLFKSKLQKPPKCIYSEEQGVFDFILKPFSVQDQEKFSELEESDDKHKKTKYKSLDTSIMEIADDIAYGIHDLEDAISLKMITKEDWLQYFDNKENIINNCTDKVFPYNFDLLTESLFSNSNSRKNAIGALVHALIAKTEVSDNEGFDHPLLRYNIALIPKYEEMRKAIFNLVVKKMIKHVNVQQLEFKGQKMIVELFEVLSSDPLRFIPDLKEDEWNKLSTQEQCRSICDYIAGMTDSYAVRQYEKLLVSNRGSIFELL